MIRSLASSTESTQQTAVWTCDIDTILSPTGPEYMLVSDKRKDKFPIRDVAKIFTHIEETVGISRTLFALCCSYCGTDDTHQIFTWGRLLKFLKERVTVQPDELRKRMKDLAGSLTTPTSNIKGRFEAHDESCWSYFQELIQPSNVGALFSVDREEHDAARLELMENNSSFGYRVSQYQRARMGLIGIPVATIEAMDQSDRALGTILARLGPDEPTIDQ